MRVRLCGSLCVSQYEGTPVCMRLWNGCDSTVETDATEMARVDVAVNVSVALWLRVQLGEHVTVHACACLLV